MTCSFTGHRPHKLMYEKTELIKQALKQEIIAKTEAGTDHFMTGMALGVDMLAAEAVIELKSVYPDIRLTAVIPCLGQDRFWSAENKGKYAYLLSKCDEKTVLQDKYTSACMHIRNKYLVDHADDLVAVWDGSDGGTANTVNLAVKRGVRVTVIDPVTLEKYDIAPLI